MRKLKLTALAALVLMAIIALSLVGDKSDKNRKPIPASASTKPPKSELDLPLKERVMLDSRGDEACADFKRLRSQGEASLALNMVNLGANSGHSSNGILNKSGKVIAQYLLCSENPSIKDCRDISKYEMLQALAAIEQVCGYVR